ncbi:leucine-rich repeat protein, partial [Pseudoflavonifractor phocaeensis]|uniref:leucine-rich repeat protein n=1 Tax=Pseudoflavonifractor phocaeensis TaxID=1870988 RepID=UPI00195BCCD7
MQTTKTITKRIWGVLLALCMLLSLMPMAAFAAEDPGVVYDYQFVTEDTIEIMGYNGTETNLVIPSQINGYTVVGIGDLDLLGDDTDTVESVVVPDTVKYIERFAYYPNTAYYVSSLTKVTLPEGLETIGDNAFASAPGLSEINLPSTLKSIGERAFMNCNIDNFTIPAGVEYIGANAFNETYMAVRKANEVRARGGDPFIVIGGELVKYAGDDTVVTVPNGVRGIATDAFSPYGGDVTSITLPDSVEYIADGAFGTQSELTTVNFGSGLKEIGDTAFSGCDSLNNVVLPEGLKKIGDNAFAGCSSLDSISFPGTLETLYPGSLRGTPYWENLPGGENYLGSVFCFKETELDPWSPFHVDVRPGTLGIMEWQSSQYDTTMSLPDGLRYIGPDAFPDGMYELVDFTLPESVTYIDHEAGVPISAVRDLPDALTYIGDKAFSGHSIDISYLEIPNGVKYIGEKAFGYINTDSSPKMDVRLPDSLEYMEWAAFEDNNIGQITNWPAAITTWNDFLLGCQMDALTLPDTILNVHRLTSYSSPVMNLNRVKVIEGFSGYGYADIYTSDTIQLGSGTILMPNLERVFPNTHIGGDGAGVVAIPNMEVYVPFNGVDEGFDEHLNVVIFEPSMLEGLPSAPPSVAPMVGSFTDVRTNDWFAGAVEYVVNNGLFSGVSDTSFAPNDPVTRGMLVTVLWRAAGEPSASASA